MRSDVVATIHRLCQRQDYRPSNQVIYNLTTSHLEAYDKIFELETQLERMKQAQMRKALQ